MNKADLINAVIERLRADLALYQKAALAARAEATDEQSKAENKYDTRGLEAAYLARGQSKQALELEQAIIQFEKLRPRAFGKSDGIETGAVVELQSGREKDLYFVGPRAGGTEVMFENREVLVITPESPLGSQLAGRKQGDKCELDMGGRKQNYTVSAVW